MRKTPAIAASLVILPLLAGCASGPASPRGIAIDGDVREWRSSAAATADADSLYIRFSPGETVTLQANDETTRLVLDLDADPATGKSLVGPPDIGVLGVDLEVLMSPPVSALPAGEAQRLAQRRASRGEPASPFTSGMTVLRHDASGVTTRLGHADIGFMASPTYASDWFEARIDRQAQALQGTGIDTAGALRGIVLVTDAAGDVVRFSEPFDASLPPAPATDVPAVVGIPAQPAGTIRVLSMNVLRGKPLTEPAPFARLIAAVQPDVLLLQEADDMSPESLEAWLSGYVGPLDGKHEWSQGVQSLAGGVGAWDAIADPELGVAIATPHLIAEPYEQPVTIAHPDTGQAREVRVLAALVSTPAGDALAASTHMKCCGSAGSVEDRIRYAEADAINARLGQIIDRLRTESGRAPDAWLIGGDLNLVGTRGPIEALGAGLGEGGADLRPAETPVLGDRVSYTWRDDRSDFGPGRLDWVLAGGAEAVQAFALDTRLLDPAVLERHGLLPTDSAVSDHLPVVVDLRP